MIPNIEVSCRDEQKDNRQQIIRNARHRYVCEQVSKYGMHHTLNI